MDIILVPGFWLDASSWAEVTPPLVAAGHTVHPLTPPGLESVDAPRDGIGLRDHVDATIAVLDELGRPAVLVGHSGGGAVIHAVVDARPNLVTRAIYVDSGPLGEGGVINDELPVVNGEIPLPDWDFFGEEDLVDLTDELRSSFRARAIAEPRGVAYDKQQLSKAPGRYGVPATVITCEFTPEQLQAWITAGAPAVRELALIEDVEYVELPTGHWPQFTKPAELGAAILAAVDRS